MVSRDGHAVYNRVSRDSMEVYEGMTIKWVEFVVFKSNTIFTIYD